MGSGKRLLLRLPRRRDVRASGPSFAALGNSVAHVVDLYRALARRPAERVACPAPAKWCRAGPVLVGSSGWFPCLRLYSRVESKPDISTLAPQS